MYTCELCNFTWTNEENQEYKKHTPFRCPRCNPRPERSKREDLNNGFFPPPWDAHLHPEKTDGWLAFQKEMRMNPKYYLGCGALNSMET